MESQTRLDNIRVLECLDSELVVIKCIEKRWKICVGCKYFYNCIFKDLNRVGIIPNLIDDFKSFKESFKKRKFKFFIELKNFNKSNEKNL